MYPICSLQNTDFRMLTKIPVFGHCEAFAASVDCVLADLPFNIRRVRDAKSSNPYIFSSIDVSSLFSKMLVPEAHFHIFCSALQSGWWYIVASKEVEVQEGLVCLVLILIENKRMRKRYLMWNRICFTIPVLFVLKVVPLEPASHSKLPLLEKPSTCGEWV